MSRNPLCLYPEEVRALLDRGRVCVVRPVKPQPPMGESGDTDRFDGPRWFTTTKVDRDGHEVPGPEAFGIHGDDWHIKSPFVPGAVLCGKERWGRLRKSGKAVYHADNPNAIGMGSNPWRSGATMPYDASRFTLRVESVRACRCWEITEAECLAAVGDDGKGTHPAEFGYIHRCFGKVWDSRHRAHPWSTSWAWVATVSRDAAGGKA